MKTINSINGIPLHYARLTNHPYGTRGVQRNFSIEANFLKKLEAAVKEVFDHCPFGAPEVITTAGIFVDKPGEHRHGKAFDLDAIFWKEKTLTTTNFLHQKELYLGIESFLRKHFGIVLNYFYPNHKDHWHVDTSVPVDYNTYAQSETLYVQMVLRYIYGEEILIDGIWGRQTDGVVKKVFKKLNIPTPITTKKNYIQFLDLTGKIAFKLCEEKNSPLQLLNNLNDVVTNLNAQDKHIIQEALNSFIDHEETAQWLIGFTINPHDRIDEIINDIV